MRDVLVFGGSNSLDFFDVRQAVLRIPEVGLRLKDAQAIWDKVCGTRFSFQHFLAAEDEHFFKNINIKNLTLALVQLGLYDRYVRLFRVPQFLVGNVENDSAVNVAAGIVRFEELVLNSQACFATQPKPEGEAHQHSVGLRGQALPKYQAFSGGQALGSAELIFKKTLVKLIEERGIKKVVHVGPGSLDKHLIMSELSMTDVQVLESIDIDPMLGWFWSTLREKPAQKPAAC